MNAGYERKCFKKFRHGVAAVFGMDSDRVHSEIFYMKAEMVSESTSRTKEIESRIDIEQEAVPAGDEHVREPESKRARVGRDEDIILLD